MSCISDLMCSSVLYVSSNSHFDDGPLFLEYPRSLDQRLGKNNGQTLLGVHQIPSDPPIRYWLDATDPGPVKPLFSSLFQASHHPGLLGPYGIRGEGCPLPTAPPKTTLATTLVQRPPNSDP